MKKIIFYLLLCVALSNCKKEKIVATSQQPTQQTNYAKITFAQSVKSWNCGPYYESKLEQVKLYHTYAESQSGSYFDISNKFIQTFAFDSLPAGTYWYSSKDEPTTQSGCTNNFISQTRLQSFTINNTDTTIYIP